MDFVSVPFTKMLPAFSIKKTIAIPFIRDTPSTAAKIFEWRDCLGLMGIICISENIKKIEKMK